MTIDRQLLSFTDIVDLISFPVALTGKETGVKRYTVSFLKFHKLNLRCLMLIITIIKFSNLIGINRTVYSSCLSNFTAHTIAHAVIGQLHLLRVLLPNSL